MWRQNASATRIPGETRRKRPSRKTGHALLAAICLLASSAARAQSAAPAKDSKLSSILVELRQAVAQRSTGSLAASRPAWVASFSMASLPGSIKSAVLARSMRISQQAEVQVNIEMSSLSAENLTVLQQLGVRVEIQAEPDPAAGSGRVFSRVPTVQVEVPVEALQQVEELPFVHFVRLPRYAMSSGSSTGASPGSLTTQGDSILRALALRTSLGVTGAGVRIGVISSGIGGLFQTGCTASCAPVPLSGAAASPILSGDLPGSATSTATRNSAGKLTSVSSDFLFAAQSFRTDGDLGDTADGSDGAEGSAMLEIIHHLAPGAALSFANADSDLAFESAVDYLASIDDIVVDDQSFLAPSYDGTSDISQNTAAALNNPANPIRAYVTNAGNYALNHYLGAYTDSGIDGYAYTGEHGDMHQFSGIPPVASSQSAVSQLNTSTIDNQQLGPLPFDPLISLPAGATVTVGLSWDDRPGASNNDFDLFLVPVLCQPAPAGITPPIQCSLQGTAVAHGTTAQTGAHDPYEEVSYANTSSQPMSLAIVIEYYKTATSTGLIHNFDMFVIKNGAKGSQPNHNYYTVSGSIPSEADAGGTPVSVITVGAINQKQCDATPTLSIPDNCTQQLEGYSGQGPTQITPQTSTAAIKPNLTAVDQVCITGAGGFGVALPPTGVTCQVAPSFSYTPMLFGGTSAAAPHVAAIAALTLQMAPCLLATQGANTASAAVFARQTLYTVLTGQPVTSSTAAAQYASPLSGYDLPSTSTYPFGVPNSAEGWGLVDAYASAASLLPLPTAQNTSSSDPTLIESVSATTIFGTSGMFGAPAVLTSPTKLTNLSGCPVTNIAWNTSFATGTAQGTKTTATFPVGITPVTVAPSINGGVSYPPPAIVPSANVVVTDFYLTVSASTPAPVTVPAGTPAVFVVTATSTQYGYFTNPVALSCQATGMPPGAMCIFSPAIVTPGVTSSTGTTQSATSTLTIYTSGTVAFAAKPARAPDKRALHTQLICGSILMLGMLILPCGSRKTLLNSLGLVAVVLICLSSTSCGTNTGSTTETSTGPATYTVTVVGTSNQDVKTTTLTFTVQ